MTRWKAICLFAWLPVFAAIFGCGKSSPPPASAPPAVASPQQSAPPETKLRIHWQGKGKISADQNAASLMKIWDLPESLRLQSQTLDKLSTAPGRLLLGQTNQASTNLLRPLLDDVLTQECYLEIRQTTNAADAPDQIVLSVHLSADRANLWQSNLTAIMQSLGATPESNDPAGWVLKSKSRSNSIEFARAGEWAVVSLAQDHNTLLDETLARINNLHTPVEASSTNAFLEGFVDLARVRNQSGSNALPKLSFALKLDKDGMATAGELLFSGGESPRLGAWNIPTNLISGSAISITAVRGLAPFLESSKLWTNLNAGPPPDQCFVWATREFPMQTYFIAPMAGASNASARITEMALRKQGPPWLTNVLDGFEKSKTTDGLSWHGFPFFSPFLRSASINGENLLMGGFFDVDMPAGPPPDGVVDGILSKTNLVYFDRELTGVRVEQWIQLGQALRFITGNGQLPSDSASFQWLKAISTRLNSCSTEITQVAPGRLSFTRKSDIGLTAIELQVLADWLESPEFPLGTYSLMVRAPEPLPL